MIKRLSALFLCVLMCMSMLPASAFADEGEDVYYLVEFVVDGETVHTIKVVKDAVIGSNAYPDPTGDGKTFHCWLLNGVPFDVANTKVEEDLTLVADRGDPDLTKGTVASGDEATCTANGWTTYPCKYCGRDIRKQDVPAGHDLELIEAQEATCTEKGNIAYYHCTGECGKLFSDPEATHEISEEDTVIGALGHHLVDVPAKEATCSEAGYKAYKKCDREGCNHKEDFESIGVTGEHNWEKHDGVCANEGCDYHCKHPAFDENNTCTTCGFVRESNTGDSTTEYEFTVTITGEGTVKWTASEEDAAEAVQSGEAITVADGAEVTIIMEPAFNYHVKQVLMNDQSMPKDRFSFEMDEDSDKSAISCVFAENKTPKAVIKSAPVPPEYTDAFTGQRNTIAKDHEVQSTEILFSAYDITPCWGGEEDDPIANNDITAPIPFTIPYPSGTDAESYDFYLYHVNGEEEKVEPLETEKGEDGVSASCRSFSPFVLFAAPIKNTASDTDPASSSSGTTIKPAEQTVTQRPDQPIISVAPIIDDGSTQTGAILGVDSTMEYMRKDSSEGYKKITGTELDDLAAGSYYVRYRATEKTEASEATTAKIEEYYTVKLKLIKGKGGYEITSDNDEFDDDIYLVRKGGDIEVRFKPENHYWLYEININDEYVGSSRVKTHFTLSNVNRKTTISYGFSDSSSSPKTADGSQITLWIAEEIISLTAMTAIVYYLFRKKETF